MAIPWLPESAPKTANSEDRTCPLIETLELLPQIRQRFGITRIGDTTELDRIGIPTFCAVVPDSADAISVYNGKGPTRDHAMCSAIMEAVERQCGAYAELATIRLRPREVSPDIGFSGLGMLESVYDQEVDFVEGLDVLSEQRVLVPFAAVKSPWHGERIFLMSSSNGLASGNNLLEAVYHALMEYIERHGWAIAHTRAHVRPRLVLEALARGIGERIDVSQMVDDPAVDRVPFPTGDNLLDDLYERIRRAGLDLRLVAQEDSNLPTVMMASINEESTEPVMSHFGLGASWSPRQAALRAITEAAQTRSVDIQGAREDLLRPGETSEAFGHHGRRRTVAPSGRWYYDAPIPCRPYSALSDRSRPCLAAELRDVLEAFRHAGIRRAVVVDISPRDLPVSVARVLVPDLESTLVDGHIGKTIRSIIGA
ncbi:MAG: YcaO-like family protein [bacterium]|nr:YcaO-like family protein [bacterium]